MGVVFGRQISVFGPKIRLLPYDPNFGQQPVCSPRRYCSFSTLGAIFRLFIPELWPFSQKKLGRRVKKSSPSPLWGLSLPVTALALSTQALRFVRGLVIAQSVLFFKNPYGSRDPLPLMENVTFFHFLNPLVTVGGVHLAGSIWPFLTL